MAVQIICCYENFCDKHIREEVMRNFTCPNCKVSASLRDIVPNKRMRESIMWFKGLLTESAEPQNRLKIGSIIKDVPSANEIEIEKENTIIKKLDINNVTEMTVEEKMEMFVNKAEAKTEDKVEEEKEPEKVNPNMPIPPFKPGDPRMFMGGIIR
jgi:hypothetical protein